MRVKNAEGKEGVWTIDLKNTGTVYKGEPKQKANVTIILSDETFTQLAEGKLDGQKAFMSGKLKTKGNMMFATKLDGVLKVRFDDIVHYHLWLTRHVQAAKAKAKL